MTVKKRILIFLSIITSLLVFIAIYIALTPANATKLTNLRDGDIVFQTSRSNQSLAIGLASLSFYTHMGIIKKTNNGFVVIEAAGPVRETKLQDWINRGYLKRLTVKRVRDISDKTALEIIRKARPYYGQAYDPYFVFGDNRMYCSELVSAAYEKAGIKLGQTQQIKDLYVNNFAVKSIFKSRWNNHPLCSGGKVKDADTCWNKVLTETLITPSSIANDSKLESVFSNYGL